MASRRSSVAVAATLLALVLSGCGSGDAENDAAAVTVSSPDPLPAHADAGHRRLDQLVGEWSVHKETYVAGGTADKPLVSDGMVSRWRWIAKTGNNFLQEEVGGDHGGTPYYRMGLLGYSPTDDRFEWSTVDSVTPMTMSYKGIPKSGGSGDISMLGEFTDPGVLGPEFVGRTIPMRTRIRLESKDRTVLEISFIPPGRPERVVDRVILTRRK
ncbi:MAG: DUF1579 family protein [Mycobacteriaceae bacterium]|nr:DUF1579 family protein [Mycobacteriaceae bacterium]